MPKDIQKSLANVPKKARDWIQFPFASCKPWKTPAFTGDEKENANDADQFLFQRLRSNYRKEWEEIAKKSHTTSLLSDSSGFLDLPPPENLRSSSRFFVATGSASSLIIDEAFHSSDSDEEDDSSTTSEEAEEITEKENNSSEKNDFVAILTRSPSPYDEFRRSMQEVVEARLECDLEVDWKFMGQLLFRYLELNSKKFSVYILQAFVDLVVVLRENSWRIPAAAGRRRW